MADDAQMLEQEQQHVLRHGQANQLAEQIAGVREEAEEMHFRRILPEEIWGMVTDSIEDFATLENLSNSSLFFRNLLLDRRCDFLAPAVLKLMAANEYLHSFSWVVSNCPSAYEQRKVCRSWCLGVDLAFEQHPENTMELTSRLGSYPGPDILQMSPTLEGTTSREFLDHFDLSHAHTERSPVLGGELCVATREGAVNTRRVLQIYGRHVTSLKVSDPGTLIHVGNLRAYLNALPNLRSLQFMPWSEFNEPGFYVRYRDIQLPVLPNLKTVVGKLHVVKESRIVENNPTVSNLNLDIRLYASSRPVVFPHVKHLKVELYTKQRAISIITPAISKLTVHWCELSDSLYVITRKDYFLRWQRVFAFINQNWGGVELLKEVELELPGFHSFITIGRNLERGPFYRLELRQVERLRLFLHSPCCLDFILPMRKSLEFLHVRLHCFSGDRIDRSQGLGRSLDMAKKCQKIQVLGYEERLYESNVWDKFPKLQKVIFEGHLKYTEKPYYGGFGKENRTPGEKKIYTRKEYEKIYCRNKY